MMSHNNLSSLAQQLGELLKLRQWMIATAESCTGGQLSTAITDIPGSSKWFDRGFITYSNSAKNEMLGVKLNSINQFGAVSSEVAKEMAEGALYHSNANITVSITGIAGPLGGMPDKPLGTVFFGIAMEDSLTQTFHECFQGDRIAIRTQATVFALKKVIDFLV
jgi:nicotinamide-nucleotide amidase